MIDFSLKAVDKVEILTLQDNYIDITAMDSNAVVTRANPLKDGEIRASVLAEHGFSALVKTTTNGKTHTLLFDFGFSENGAAQNAATLGVDMTEVEAAALSHGHSDHTGGMEKLTAMIGKKIFPFWCTLLRLNRRVISNSERNLRFIFPNLPGNALNRRD